jgi:predicted metal-dependent enzyme (double-stranded beta helix superfamily)
MGNANAAATETSLERFIKKTRELFARESDPETRWTTMHPFMKELLDDPRVIEASKKWPTCQRIDNRTQNLLFYEDPDYKFVLNGMVFSSDRDYGVPDRLHDHGHIYTLYGLLDGKQRILRYERIDDRSTPDFAEVRSLSNSECGPGEIDLVRPWEIHAEASAGERVVALIARSERSGGFLQGRYVPEKNSYWQGYGPIQVPTPFYG